jgi:polyribonucleotide nucleotidyltransferase
MMKKYWVVSVLTAAIVAGTSLFFMMNNGKKETVDSPGENVVVTQVVNKTNLPDPEVKKQEAAIEEIERMFKPEWEKVNQLAEQRLAELIKQAEKEFHAKKERNQDVTRLEGKYIEIYNDYEQNTKTQIDRIIASMQKEVITKELTNDIGDQYFELYRIQKEKRIEKVVSELKKFS